jgi:hypothetical protein
MNRITGANKSVESEREPSHHTYFSGADWGSDPHAFYSMDQYLLILILGFLEV